MASNIMATEEGEEEVLALIVHPQTMADRLLRETVIGEVVWVEHEDPVGGEATTARPPIGHIIGNHRETVPMPQKP